MYITEFFSSPGSFMHKGSLESKVLPIDIDYMLVFAHQDVGRLYLSTLEAELEGPDLDDAGLILRTEISTTSLNASSSLTGINLYSSLHGHYFISIKQLIVQAHSQQCGKIMGNGSLCHKCKKVRSCICS